MTVCWRELICAWSWFSTMAEVIQIHQHLVHIGGERERRTITLRKPTPHPPIPLIIHPLNHHAVPLKIVPYIISSPSSTSTPSYLPLSPSILQPINLLLPPISPLLRLLELLFQLLNLTILFRIAYLLAVLFASIRYSFPQAHGSREGADECRGEGRDNEGFL